MRIYLNLILSLFALFVVIYYSFCGGACSFLKGFLFSIPLEFFGMGFMILSFFLSATKKNSLLFFVLSFGFGAEVYLFAYQFFTGIFCPYCIAFGITVCFLYFLNFKKELFRYSFLISLLSFLFFILFLRVSIPSY